MKYEKLFQPGKIGNLELRNRVVMTAMGALMGDWNGCTTPEQIRFYEDRAKGGCGLIIPEFTSVDADSGHCNPIQLGIYDSRQIKSFQLICEAVHRHGAKIFIQLHHGGREAPPACNGGRQAMAPSVELNSVVGRATILPREMTIEDIDNLVGKYVQAAVNSELAGADGVEVHAAHGYLVQQFLSPYTNKRTDEYGGTAENRARFAVEAVSAVREKLPDMPIDYKLAVRQENPHYGNAGVIEDELKVFVPMLEKAGVTSFHVTLANHSDLENTIPPKNHPYFSEPGCFLKFCDEVRQYTNLPICGVGGLTDPDFVEKQLADGRIQCAAMSRQLLADPDWVNKLKDGHADQIHRCVRCNKKCLGGLMQHQGTHCIYEK